MMDMRQLGAVVGAILLTAVAAASQTTRSVDATAAPAAKKDAPTTQPGGRVTRHGWFPARVRKAPAPKLPGKVELAFVIPIRDRTNGITDTTYESIKGKVTRCRSKGAQLVIFDMNTPGGSVAAMQRIVGLITDELDDVYTVAYVRKEAISAGAIISLACDEIIMTPTGKIGDAMPIIASPTGQLVPIPKEERGKIESYLRSEVRLLAERNGHNKPLCEAMITLSRRVWLVRKTETRELKLINPDADNWESKITGAPGGKGRRPSLVESGWEFVKEVDGPDGLVTLTADEALEIGLVDHLIETSKKDPFAGLKEHYNVTSEAIVLVDSWSETLVSFLTSRTVVSVLMMLGMMGAYMEFQAPGFGLPGAVAIVCFAVVFGSHFLIGLAQWWEIGLFFVGLILIAVEVFVIPGFGIAGISGILCCLFGFMAMIIPNAPAELPWPQTDLDWSSFTSGIFALGLGIVGAAIASAIFARYLPKIPAARRFMLGPVEAAVIAPPATEDAPIMHVEVGDTGTVVSMCRPVGAVRFGNEICDATSEGSMIPAGAKVRVIKRTGNQLIVEEV